LKYWETYSHEEFRPAIAGTHDAIAAYCAEVAGTKLDLDPELEAAAIDHLLDSEP
jgi:hypothetical protein